MISTTVISAKAFVSWGERAYEKLDARSCRLRLQREFMGPAWTLGFYHEVLQTACSTTAVFLMVEDSVEPGMDFTIRYTW